MTQIRKSQYTCSHKLCVSCRKFKVAISFSIYPYKGHKHTYIIINASDEGICVEFER